MANIWRIHIKPEGGVDSIAFALRTNALGIGWSVDGGRAGMTKEEYFTLAPASAAHYEWGPGWQTVVGRFVNDIHEGDLCWMRDPRPGKGEYYLGQMVGDWEYTVQPECQEAGFSQVRHVDAWKMAGLQDAVPGKVVANFRASAVVNPVKDETAVAYSKLKFNELCELDVFEVPHFAGDLFALLSDEDLEDVVGIYLQERGLRLISSSSKLSTPAYECLLKTQDGKPVGVQVKSGDAPLDQNDYRMFPGDFYLFASCGVYTGESQPNVTCIPPKEIRDFIAKNFDILPGRVQTSGGWTDFKVEPTHQLLLPGSRAEASGAGWAFSW
jgi:hypothetical protein